MSHMNRTLELLERAIREIKHIEEEARTEAMSGLASDDPPTRYAGIANMTDSMTISETIKGLSTVTKWHRNRC